MTPDWTSEKVMAGLVVKTVQLKITVKEEAYLAKKREELIARFPGMNFSDTAICRHLIHAGLGITSPRTGETDNDPTGQLENRS